MECFDPENQHELIDYLNNISLLENYNLFIKNIEKIDIFAPSLKRKQGLSSDFKFRKFVNKKFKNN